jgi:formamidopyrimidine-DNA glycosylase
VVRSLRRTLKGVRVTAVRCFFPPVVAGDLRELRGALEGRRLQGFRRYGKYIFLLPEEGTPVAIHLRMTGQLLMAERDRSPDKHTHLEADLDLPGQKLVYRDVRKFGRFALAAGGVEWFVAEKRLGPDALTVTPAGLREALARTARCLKASLLDQSVVAGLGNIYTDEILHRVGISPRRPAREVREEEIGLLCESMREILYAAIADSGTTISDFVGLEGRRGGFQFALRVYGRKGEPCSRCGEPIQRSVVAGRGTWYCAVCQR